MPKRVLIAPDSFKGSATARQVAEAIARGWARVRPTDEIVLRPMADGGEGTMDAVALAVPGSAARHLSVEGPDGRSVDTSWLLLPPRGDDVGPTGVVELAATSGLTLLDGPRPLDAHTVGFGQAIAAAIDDGVTRLLLALGGSASTDGGAGMLIALGARLLDAEGASIPRGNRGLERLMQVDLEGLRRLPLHGATVLGDVTNPLLGELGAAAVFGPQKGASQRQVRRMDDSLARYAALLPADPAAPGAGAAGGTGFGLLAWGASMASGADTVAMLLNIPRLMREADVLITGEGRFDAQTSAGKAPGYLLALAQQAGVQPLLVAGAIQSSPDGFAAAVALADLASGSRRAIATPLPYLEQAAVHLAARSTRGA